MPEAASSYIHVQLTFYDATYKKFFGITWTGPGVRANSHELNYDESVFFGTPFNDENIFIIVELVGNDKNGDLVSFGWSYFRPFVSKEQFAKRFE
jgi:hypothetical protein